MIKTVKRIEPEGFAEFWALWLPYARRNDGRGEARQCFAKHVASGVDGRDIADGAAWYLRSLKEAEKPYIPLASTWINRCAYEDFAPKEREYQLTAAKPVDAPKAFQAPKSKWLQNWEAQKREAGEALQ